MYLENVGGTSPGGQKRQLTQLLAAVCIQLLLAGETAALPRASPDFSGSYTQDPQNPDFNGLVDFSNAVPGPDGSWCITKTEYVDHMENDEVKECWHQNITQCHDTYITEFLPNQEQVCEDTFWKSCKIDFKDMPFNYTLKHCHTPMIKKCDDESSYGSPPKTVCRTWFESECNTTYIETSSGAPKPNTWCNKKPKKICAPDNCNMVQGPEDCRDRVMVSTIQKPEELCQLQPQKHCRLVTKLVPHLTTREVCKDIPKEICVMKQVNPHPVQKPVQLKWCTKKPPQLPSYAPPPSSYLPAAAPAPTSYLPAAPASSSYLPVSAPSPSSFKASSAIYSPREDTEPFTVIVDGQKYNSIEELPQEFQKLTLPIGPLPSEPFRQDRRQQDSFPRFTRHAVKAPLAFPHMKPGHNPNIPSFHRTDLHTEASEVQTARPVLPGVESLQGTPEGQFSSATTEREFGDTTLSPPTPAPPSFAPPTPALPFFAPPTSARPPSTPARNEASSSPSSPTSPSPLQTPPSSPSTPPSTSSFRPSQQLGSPAGSSRPNADGQGSPAAAGQGSPAAAGQSSPAKKTAGEERDEQGRDEEHRPVRPPGPPPPPRPPHHPAEREGRHTEFSTSSSLRSFPGSIL